MDAKTIDVVCPGCGAALNLNMTECPYCHRPVVISTFESVYSMVGPEVGKYARTYEKISAGGVLTPR